MKLLIQGILKLCLICAVAYPIVNVTAETGKTFEVPAKKDEIEEVRFKDEM
ncbi:MAG: hypothetical protein ACI9OH_003167, partial [Oleispira sp.]